MMNIDNLTCMLMEEDIQIEPVENIKNGISCKGFSILTDGIVRPIVYYSSEDTTETLLERIKRAKQNTMPDFDINCLFTRDNLQKHVRLCIQRRGTEQIVKRIYLDTELIVKLYIPTTQDETGSIKLTEKMLAMANVKVDEVFEWAISNTDSLLKMESLNDLVGIPDVPGAPMFFVASTVDKLDGGSALAYPKIFKHFCETMNLPSCLILPSSTQEILILEETGYEDINSLAELVSEVNECCVDNTIRMNPTVYRYILEDNMVYIATAKTN